MQNVGDVCRSQEGMGCLGGLRQSVVLQKTCGWLSPLQRSITPNIGPKFVFMVLAVSWFIPRIACKNNELEFGRLNDGRK